ncbi:MAG: cyclic 2,3-diphosphoglycerate synthase [Desulfurococcales archaeon]|nr:cyclic 2,3-diphosphoglycerate synthase [Desulfurococcales archaeon]MCE4626690.1 cyclic 2,3-diphosphoglycerate synthase [Desulfurococcales archaeon]
MMTRPKKVVIMGAGGRDFHNFNVFFRDNPEYRVVAFTTAQIPGIEGRRYPPELAGSLYPSGIPIVPEEDLEKVVKEFGVDLVALSYSDLLYNDVGRKLSAALGAGASFIILGPRDTMLVSSKPVIAVTAVRTGAGKSSVSRAVVKVLQKKGFRVVPVRHPMAYGDLAKMAVQRFETIEDLDKYGVTVEEREEYEHYLEMGLIVYAGVDYGEILRRAEREADIILWDGGNNDWPFYKPDYMITVADAMRPGHEIGSFPGEVNVRLANAVIINKADQASKEAIEEIKRNVKVVNPRAEIAVAESEVVVDEPEAIKGKKVVIVEDSPTVTHGGSPYGAGYVAAKKYGAGEIVDPRPYAKGIIAEMYKEYTHMGPVIPSTGYTPEQIKALEETINSIPADVVVSGTPIRLERIINVNKPIIQVRYDVKIIEGPTIEDMINEFLERTREKMRYSLER